LFPAAMLSSPHSPTFLRADYHSVCSFFIAHNVGGELASNEPDKQISHWVDLDGIDDNIKVPSYHKDFLRHMIKENRYLNAHVEWLPPNDRVEWSINEQGIYPISN
jgi:8-oxo-dGTP diphosphatase